MHTDIQSLQFIPHLWFNKQGPCHMVHPGGGGGVWVCGVWEGRLSALNLKGFSPRMDSVRANFLSVTWSFSEMAKETGVYQWARGCSPASSSPLLWSRVQNRSPGITVGFPLASRCSLGTSCWGFTAGLPLASAYNSVKTTRVGYRQSEKVYLRCRRKLFTALGTDATSISLQ